MEKKYKGILVLTFTVIFCCYLSSCGTLNVFVNPESTFSKKNSITINGGQDLSGTIGELQFLLQSNGYKVISYNTAKNALNFDANWGNESLHGEITNTVEFNTVYVINLNYTYYNDGGLWYAYKSFSADITDLRTGEIIMTASFRGDKRVKAVLRDLVTKMNGIIK